LSVAGSHLGKDCPGLDAFVPERVPNELSRRLAIALLIVRRADEGTLSRLLVEASVLLAASRGDPTTVLKEARLPIRWTPMICT
jgi:hypothetical protein